MRHKVKLCPAVGSEPTFELTKRRVLSDLSGVGFFFKNRIVVIYILHSYVDVRGVHYIGSCLIPSIDLKPNYTKVNSLAKIEAKTLFSLTLIGISAFPY